MKKLFTLLLVLMIAVTCFAGCTPKKDADLRDTLNQISKLSDADSFKTEMNITLGVSFDDAMLSEDSLGELLGEAASAYMPLMSLFIKDEKTAELACTANGIITKEGGAQMLVTIGEGENALTCTGIASDKDVFVDVKTIYTWFSNMMAPAMGEESFPVWPYQNAYVSMQDLMALYSGEIGSMGATNPQMLEAVQNGLMETISDESLADLVEVLEQALTDAGMLTTKDCYVTILVNGDNIAALPEALANAADGAELENEWIVALSTSKDDFQEVAQTMKTMNFSGEIGIKANNKAVDCRVSVAYRIEDEAGFSGNISLAASAKVEATEGVSVRAPGNVMTEAEISDFFSAFAQMMG